MYLLFHLENYRRSAGASGIDGRYNGQCGRPVIEWVVDAPPVQPQEQFEQSRRLFGYTLAAVFPAVDGPGRRHP